MRSDLHREHASPWSEAIVMGPTECEAKICRHDATQPAVNYGPTPTEPNLVKRDADVQQWPVHKVSFTRTEEEDRPVRQGGL